MSSHFPGTGSRALCRTNCSTSGVRGTLWILFLATAMTTGLAGCGPSNTSNATTTPTPAITFLNPTSGAVGTAVTITGNNFGATQGTSTVAFNGTAAAAASTWSATSIVVTVPAGATTGNVVVTVSGVASNGSSFTVLPTPAITSLKPTSGPVATAVTITGTNFGTSQLSNSSVSLNGKVAPVISWTNTSIVADMPSSAITGNIVVTAAGVPSAGTAFTVTAGATSTCGSGALGSESVLNGTYTYVMGGFQGGSPGNHFARIGSFIASGAGSITGGEEDLNVSTGSVHHTVVAANSSYALGADNRGCVNLTFNDATVVTFRISVGTLSSGVAGRGHIIEFDDNSGGKMRASGILLQATTSAFSGGTLATLQANYAFGLDGFDPVGGHVAEGGTFTLVPVTGVMSNSTLDFSDAGNTFLAVTNATPGSIATAVSATTGRTTGTFSAAGSCSAPNPVFCTWKWVIYVVNANQFFIMPTDTLGANTPIVSGRAIATTTGFTASSLNNANGYIVEGMGATTLGLASAELDQLTFNSSTLNVSGTQWTYMNPTAAKNTLAASTPYVASAVGRFTYGNYVLYLTNPAVGNNIAAFVVGTDANATGGNMVVQAATTLSASGNGTLFFGTVFMADNNVQNETGVVGLVSGGAGTSDTVSGAVDLSGTASPFLASGTFVNEVFTVGANGATTATDSGGKPIVGVADGSALFFIDESGDASITVAEQ